MFFRKAVKINAALRGEKFDDVVDKNGEMPLGKCIKYVLLGAVSWGLVWSLEYIEMAGSAINRHVFEPPKKFIANAFNSVKIRVR